MVFSAKNKIWKWHASRQGRLLRHLKALRNSNKCRGNLIKGWESREWQVSAALSRISSLEISSSKTTIIKTAIKNKITLHASHFRINLTTWQDLKWKTAAANLKILILISKEMKPNKYYKTKPWMPYCKFQLNLTKMWKFHLLKLPNLLKIAHRKKN